jgi:lipoprotein-releasing system permease protein
MSVIAHIAGTHLLSRKRQMAVSLLGIVLGVGFFIAVSGLMRGSENDFINRLVNNSPHITLKDERRQPPLQPLFGAYDPAIAALTLRHVKPQDDRRGIRTYQEKLAHVADIAGSHVAPILTGSVVATYAGQEVGVTITGFVPQQMRAVSTLETLMTAGNFETLATYTDGILIGEALAEKLGLTVGNNLTITAPNGTVRLMKVVGLFKSGNKRYDETQTYTLLKKVQVLLDRPNTANRFIFKLDDPYQAGAVAREIEARTGGYLAESWQEASADIMGTLAIRNTIMYSVVSAILIVAAFGIYNIISTIVMEKTRDIAILKSIGFRSGDIQRIFLLQGVILGVIGSVVGCALGALMMTGLQQIKIKTPFNTDKLPLPLDWGWPQFIIAVVFALVAAVLAAWLPARKAGSVQPVTILRGAA